MVYMLYAASVMDTVLFLVFRRVLLWALGSEEEIGTKEKFYG